MDLDQALALMAASSAEVERRISADDHSLRDGWLMYGNEARWGRAYLAEELNRLPRGAQVLEVGAGTLALSAQLAREGFEVTALEPAAEGFSRMDALGTLVLDVLSEDGLDLKRLDMPAEQLAVEDSFDFAFSINVLEHVDSVESTLDNIVGALRPGASLRFRCPNYAFPYEPHFGWMVPPHKGLANRLNTRRLQASDVEEAHGLWESLNWVTASQLRHWAEPRKDVELRLNPDALHDIWIRAQADEALAGRHQGFFTQVLRIVDAARLTQALRWIPTSVQPVIDGKLTRRS
jgi:2-polyprenyl-3-methyl-5-hydroxy-6-metoxy-1,4-benzoquinol methylase